MNAGLLHEIVMRKRTVFIFEKKLTWKYPSIEMTSLYTWCVTVILHFSRFLYEQSAECSSLYSFKVKIVTSPMSIMHGRYMEIRRQYPHRVNRKKTLWENDRIEKSRCQWCQKADIFLLFLFLVFSNLWLLVILHVVHVHITAVF